MTRFASLLAVSAVLVSAGVAHAQYYTTYYYPATACYQPSTVYYSAAPTTTYYAAAPTTTYYAAAPTTTYYAAAPTTTYYAAAPTTTYYAAAPTTTYYAAAPTTVYYAAAPAAGTRVSYYAPAVSYPATTTYYTYYPW